MKLQPQQIEPLCYTIEIAGKVAEDWLDWFRGLQITFKTSGSGSLMSTIYTAPIDQAELRGILNKVWDMNLSLISIKRIDTERTDKRDWESD